MKKSCYLFLVMLMTVSSALAGRTLLIAPARYDMVNLSFDLLDMFPKDLDIACYKGDTDVERLEFFKRDLNRWDTFPSSAWKNGDRPFGGHQSVVLVGNSIAATSLLKSATWAENILTPSGHMLHEVVNSVHSILPLSEKQWDSLAQIYGFKLKKTAQPSRYDRLPPQKARATPVVRWRDDTQNGVTSIPRDNDDDTGELEKFMPDVNEEATSKIDEKTAEARAAELIVNAFEENQNEADAQDAVEKTQADVAEKLESAKDSAPAIAPLVKDADAKIKKTQADAAEKLESAKDSAPAIAPLVKDADAKIKKTQADVAEKLESAKDSAPAIAPLVKDADAKIKKTQADAAEKLESAKDSAPAIAPLVKDADAKIKKTQADAAEKLESAKDSAPAIAPLVKDADAKIKKTQADAAEKLESAKDSAPAIAPLVKDADAKIKKTQADAAEKLESAKDSAPAIAPLVKDADAKIKKTQADAAEKLETEIGKGTVVTPTKDAANTTIDEDFPKVEVEINGAEVKTPPISGIAPIETQIAPKLEVMKPQAHVEINPSDAKKKVNAAISSGEVPVEAKTTVVLPEIK